jgi:hypothetical protein
MKQLLVLAVFLFIGTQSFASYRYFSRCTVVNQGQDFFWGEDSDNIYSQARQEASKNAIDRCKEVTKEAELPCNLVDCKVRRLK